MTLGTLPIDGAVLKIKQGTAIDCCEREGHCGTDLDLKVGSDWDKEQQEKERYQLEAMKTLPQVGSP